MLNKYYFVKTISLLVVIDIYLCALLKKIFFIKGTTFDELYATFVFDRRIRNIMFKYILIIENNMKSIISYQLSKNMVLKKEIT